MGQCLTLAEPAVLDPATGPPVEMPPYTPGIAAFAYQAQSVQREPTIRNIFTSFWMLKGTVEPCVSTDIGDNMNLMMQEATIGLLGRAGIILHEKKALRHRVA